MATIAFGMGVDLPDVCEVIHVGPPDDVESYVQETGCACLPSLALLLHVKGSSFQLTKRMKEYRDNVDIHRLQLFENVIRYQDHTHH